MATAITLTSDVQQAANDLLWSDWARVRGVVCSLELTENGHTLHMARGEAWFEARCIDFETCDVDGLAGIVAQGLALLAL